MRAVVLAIGLLVSFTSHATKPESLFVVDKKAGPVFAKRIAGAESWEDLFAQVKNTLPGTVVKEMEKLGKEIPFPDMRAEKSTLILIDSDGKRLYISFGTHGSVTFNGKKWKLRPLVPVAEEVRRIQAFLEENAVDAPKGSPTKRKTKRRLSLMDVLMPEANAVVSGFAGTALAGATVSETWASAACGASAPSGEEKADCAAMGAPIKVVMKKGEDRHVPIKFICPKNENGNRMEYWYYSEQFSSFVKETFWFQDGEPSKYAMEHSTSFSGNYQAGKTVSISGDTEGQAVFAKNMQSRICNGSDTTKRRYLKMLTDNWNTYVKAEPAAVEKDEGDGGSQEREESETI